jgi:hypothetical protein
MAIEFCRITTLGSPTGYTVVTLRLSCAQPAAREREERLEGLTRSRFALLASWTSHSSHGIVDLSQQ